MPGDGFHDRVPKLNPNVQAEFQAGPLGAWHIAGGMDSGVRCAGDVNFDAEEFADSARKVGDAERSRGTDIVCAKRLASKQEGPQPDGKVRCIEIGAVRRAVTAHPDRAAGEGIADEVANSKVCIQGQMRPDEGKAAGNFRLEAVLP